MKNYIQLLAILIFSTNGLLAQSSYSAKFLISEDINCETPATQINPPLGPLLLNIGTTRFSAKENVILKGNSISIKGCQNKSISIKIDENLLPGISVFSEQPPFMFGNAYSYSYSTSVPSFDYTKPVGMIPGSFSVSPSGGTLYQIPIDVAPGVHGMQPNLSVVYNSQAGRGLLGWGTELAGLSSITRQGSSLYYDGQLSAVDFSGTDHYVLDGKRLFPNTNGGYSPEFDDFSNTVPTGAEPQSFTTTSKDGKKIYFGTTADSKLYGSGNNTGKPLAWFVSRVEDESGNAMVFEYRDINGEKVIGKINYTLNANTGLQSENEIIFDYARTGYQSYSSPAKGVQTNKNLILKKIRIKSGGQQIRSYDFTYINKLGEAFLSYVTLQGMDNAALNPTIFNWNADPTQTFTVKNFSDFLGVGTVPNIKAMGSGDFDGDHQDEIVVLGDKMEKLTRQADGSYTRILIKNKNTIENGGQTNIENMWVFDANNDGISEIYTIQTRGSSDLTLTDGYVYLYKYDGQTGVPTFLTKIFCGVAIPFQYTILKSVVYNINPFIGDFDGNGTNDLVFTFLNPIGTGGICDQVHQGGGICKDDYQVPFYAEGVDLAKITSSERATVILTCDLEGDGKTELIQMVFGNPGHTNNTVQASAIEKLGANGMEVVPSNTNMITENRRLVPLWGDFNGDGKQDMFGYYHLPGDDDTFYERLKPQIYINSGGSLAYSDAFTQDVRTIVRIDDQFKMPRPTMDNVDGRNEATDAFLFTGDFNGDGKTDILYVKGNDNTSEYNQGYKYRFMIGISTGNGFTRLDVPCLSAGFSKENVVINDFDKDGTSDILVAEEGGNLVMYYFNTSVDGNPRLLKSIRNGLNQTSTFGYSKAITGSSSYKESTVQYAGSSNLMKYAPTWLSTSVETAGMATGGGSTEKHRISYEYEDGVLHKSGKGFLGFMKITTTESFGTSGNTNKVESFNAINTTYIFPYSTGSKTYVNQTLMKESTLTNVFLPISGKRFISYLSTAVLNDPISGTKVINTQTIEDDISKPGLGELKEQSTSYYRGQTLDATQSTSYVWGIANSSASSSQAGSKIRRIKTSTTTNQRPGVPAFTNTTSFGYDVLARMISETYYAGTGKPVVNTSTLDDYGNAIQTTASAAGEIPRTKYYYYDATKRFVERVENADHIVLTRSSYNAARALLVSTTDNLGNTTYHGYDGFGKLETISMPTGNVVTYTTAWNGSDGSYYTMTDAKYAPWEKTYFDNMGRVVRAEQQIPGGVSFSTTTYNMYGQVATTTHARTSAEQDKFTTYTYDEFLRPATMVDDIKGTTTYIYSLGESKYEVVSPAEHGTTHRMTYTMDATGQVLTETELNRGTITHTYNSNGNKLKINAYGRDVFTYQYDPTYGYQTNSIEQDKGTTQISAYTGFHEIKTVTSPKGTSNFTYDKEGRLTRKTSPEGTTNYVYNTLQQLTAITGPYAGTSVNYIYNSLGNVTQITEIKPGNKTYITKNEYDDNGNLAKIIYPNAFDVKYTYESEQGYITKVNSEQVPGVDLWSFGTIDSWGRLTTYTHGNGLTSSYNYSATTKQLTGIQLKTANNSVLLDLGYSFNAQTGNLLGRSDRSRGRTLTERFEYTNQDFIDKQYYGAQQNPYLDLNYDTWGNIISKTDAAQTYNYAAGNDKLASLTNTTAEVRTGLQVITYNTVEDIESIVEGSIKKRLVYGVDGSLARIDHINITGTTETISKSRYYAGSYEEDVDAQGNVTKQYTYISTPGGTTAVYIKSGSAEGQMYYLHTDHLGSVVMITNAAGQIHEERSYDAWGRERNVSTWAPLTNAQLAASVHLIDYGYTFKEHFADLGLVYFGARIYDPILGRWNAPDPLASQYYSLSPYHFAGNNPLRYVDTDGMQYQQVQDFADFWHNSSVGRWFINNEIAIIRGASYVGAIVAGVVLSIVATPMTGAIVAGAIIGATEGYIIARQQGATGWRMFAFIAGGAVIGGAAGAGGAAAGMAAGAAVTGTTFMAMMKGTAALTGVAAFEAAVVGGAVGGAAGGFANGFGMTALGGGNFEQSLQAGFMGAAMGAVIGAAAGGIGYGIGKGIGAAGDALKKADRARELKGVFACETCPKGSAIKHTRFPFSGVKLGVAGKAIANFGEKIANNYVANTMLAATAIIAPLVNQTNVLINEGIHEGGAYDRNLNKMSLYTLDKNWKLTTRNNLFQNNISFEDGMKLLDGATNILSAPVTLHTPFVKNFGLKIIYKQTFMKSLIGVNILSR